MNFSVRNRMVSFHLLFQLAVLVGDMALCSSAVTYYPSTEECKGNKLGDKCNEPGERLARIKDSDGLNKSKQAIGNTGKEYWTALRYHKNKGYCWDKDDSDVCKEPVNEPSILDTTGKGSWKQGWYCFWLSKAEAKLQGQKCSDNQNRPYICEKDEPSSESSSMHSNSASVLPGTIEANTRAAPMSTATSEVATSNLPNLTTPMIITQVTPSTIITTAAATTIVTTAPLLTSSLTSSLLTTEVVVVKKTLTTPGTASSLTTASDNKTTTQEKLSAEDQLRQYIAVMSSLDVSEETSLQNAANTTDNLFRSLKKSEIKDKGINVLVATQELEKFAISYGKIHSNANHSKVVSKELFAIKIQKVSADHKNIIVFSVNETSYSSSEGSASISLPPRIFKGQEAVVVSILYNGIKHWIPDPKDVELDGAKFDKLEMGSRIIATTIDPKPTSTLEENVTISFSHDKEVSKGDTSHCVFWDFTIKSELNGSWASTGCSLIRQVDREITCSCNHLTNFAVLMQVGESKVGQISSDHKLALEVITYIGCGLSLAGELLTLIAYFVLMNLKQEQLQIRFNLVVAIAIAQIVFLLGIDASESKGACIFVAALIHYFYLVGFGWMLFEGVHLYLMVVKVFNTVIRMRLFYAFAWGFPLVMVVLSLVIASGQDGGVNSYVHGDFCWVSFTNNLIWTFAAPVLAVCLINVSILARVLYEIMRMQSDKTSELDKIRQGLKALAVLFPLLGLTWLFGVLTVTDAGLVFQYIFTILNSLQGFFIFIIHILRNSDVRAAFIRKKQAWIDSRNISSSRVSSHNNTELPSNKLASHDSQELSSRRRHETCASATGYENMSMVQPERRLTPVQM